MKDDPHVTLSEGEVYTAAAAGVLRQLHNRRRGAQHRYGAKPNPYEDWGMAVEGCLGELALAKHLGVYCPLRVGGAVAGEPDVLPFHEVRTTVHETGHLLVYPGDRDDRVYWLLIGSGGRYRVAGWMFGGEAKQEVFWGGARPRSRTIQGPTVAAVPGGFLCRTETRTRTRGRTGGAAIRMGGGEMINRKQCERCDGCGEITCPDCDGDGYEDFVHPFYMWALGDVDCVVEAGADHKLYDLWEDTHTVRKQCERLSALRPEKTEAYGLQLRQTLDRIEAEAMRLTHGIYC